MIKEILFINFCAFAISVQSLPIENAIDKEDPVNQERGNNINQLEKEVLHAIEKEVIKGVKQNIIKTIEDKEDWFDIKDDDKNNKALKEEIKRAIKNEIIRTLKEEMNKYDAETLYDKNNYDNVEEPNNAVNNPTDFKTQGKTDRVLQDEAELAQEHKIARGLINQIFQTIENIKDKESDDEVRVVDASPENTTEPYEANGAHFRQGDSNLEDKYLSILKGLSSTIQSLKGLIDNNDKPSEDIQSNEDGSQGEDSRIKDAKPQNLKNVNPLVQGCGLGKICIGPVQLDTDVDNSEDHDADDSKSSSESQEDDSGLAVPPVVEANSINSKLVPTKNKHFTKIGSKIIEDGIPKAKESKEYSIKDVKQVILTKPTHGKPMGIIVSENRKFSLDYVDIKDLRAKDSDERIKIKLPNNKVTAIEETDRHALESRKNTEKVVEELFQHSRAENETNLTKEKTSKELTVNESGTPYDSEEVKKRAHYKNRWHKDSNESGDTEGKNDSDDDIQDAIEEIINTIEDSDNSESETPEKVMKSNRFKIKSSNKHKQKPKKNKRKLKHSTKTVVKRPKIEHNDLTSETLESLSREITTKKPVKKYKSKVKSSGKAEHYIQSYGKIYSEGNDFRKDLRLPTFLPKRYHWREEDFPHLGYFWFNGYQGEAPVGSWKFSN